MALATTTRNGRRTKSKGGMLAAYAPVDFIEKVKASAAADRRSVSQTIVIALEKLMAGKSAK